MLIGYLVDGAFYCQGGFQKLAEALVDGLKKNGGSIRYNASVSTIRVSGNQVQGVVLASGEQINASLVISNADLRHTVHAMVGEQYFPKRFISRLNRMELSASIFVVYIGTNLDVTVMVHIPKPFIMPISIMKPVLRTAWQAIFLGIASPYQPWWIVLWHLKGIIS